MSESQNDVEANESLPEPGPDASPEELEEFVIKKKAELAQQELRPVSDGKDEEEAEPTEDESDEQESEQDATEDERNPEPDKKDDRFEGKSRDELLRIISEQNKFIDRQGSELGELRKTKQPESSPPQKTEEDELLESVEPEDLKIMEAYIAKRERDRRESEQRKQEETYSFNREHNLRTMQELQNLGVWDSVKEEIDNRVKQSGKTAEEQASKTILSDPYYLQKQATQILAERVKTGSATNQTKNEGVVKRKKAAATVGSAGNSNSYSPQKTVKEMTAEEYKEYAQKELGVRVI